jgi:hypothetical protein
LFIWSNPELDEDRIDIWLNGGHNYGPVNQPGMTW